MSYRTPIADLLKGIAVLLMIQVHIIELFANDAISTSHAGKILMFLGAAPVAPIFAVIFGYFLASSKSSKKQLIVRGIKLFVLGMLLNLSLNFNLLLSITKGLYQIDRLPYLLGVDILQFAGISIILITFLKRIIEQSIFFTVTCCFVAAFLGHYLLNYIPANEFLIYLSSFFYGSSKWSYFPLFPWLAYPLAGIVFYQIKHRFDFSVIKEAKLWFPMLILCILFSVFTTRYAVSISSQLSLYYHHGIKFFLWTLLFLAFYGLFADEINKIIGNTIVLKYLKWLGRNVTVMYFIQWVIIGNITTEVYKTVSSPVYLVMAYIVILLVSSGLCWMYLKIKKQQKALTP
ncbi:MAG: heparan-alpha-glucosaminide N-acetyltransferase domain-containing protein [Bacteroidia bacterium]